MYLWMPDVFLVPVRYAKEDILNIKKTVILQQCNFYNNFINKTSKRKEIVIGVSLPDQIGERWTMEKKTMEEHAESKGITLKVENANFDVTKQASQVDYLISQGIDVLILIPTKGLDGEAMVEKAHKAGIKVISFETPIQNSNIDLYIAFNKIRVGELQGKYLTEKVPKGNYIIMSGDPDGIFKEGAMEYIIPLIARGNIKIVEDKAIKDWDPKIAFRIVEDALIANNNKIDAILAPNDSIAGAAIEALQTQGLAGKVAVTGQDAEKSDRSHVVL